MNPTQHFKLTFSGPVHNHHFNSNQQNPRDLNTVIAVAVITESYNNLQRNSNSQLLTTMVASRQSSSVTSAQSTDPPPNYETAIATARTNDNELVHPPSYDACVKASIALSWLEFSIKCMINAQKRLELKYGCFTLYLKFWHGQCLIAEQQSSLGLRNLPIGPIINKASTGINNLGSYPVSQK